MKTAEFCELLFLEALRIRRIYEAHKDVMERLLTPRSTCAESEASDTDGPEAERDSITPDSDLAMAGLTLIQLIRDHFSSELIRLVPGIVSEDHRCRFLNSEGTFRPVRWWAMIDHQQTRSG